MATRSNVVIKFPGTSDVYLCRHWDGYLSENGAIVAIAARKLAEGSLNTDNIVDWFTNQQYEGRPLYHLTDDIHGDIEHLYYIELTERGNVIVSHGQGYGENIPVKRYKVSTFIKKINANRRSINRRFDPNECQYRMLRQPQ